jgi:hypothetical protein
MMASGPFPIIAQWTLLTPMHYGSKTLSSNNMVIIAGSHWPPYLGYEPVWTGACGRIAALVAALGHLIQ